MTSVGLFRKNSYEAFKLQELIAIRDLRPSSTVIANDRNIAKFKFKLIQCGEFQRLL